MVAFLSVACCSEHRLTWALLLGAVVHRCQVVDLLLRSGWAPMLGAVVAPG